MEEAEVISANKRLSNKSEALRELRRNKKENIEDDKPLYMGDDVPIDDQWKLFLQVCEILFQKKR